MVDDSEELELLEEDVQKLHHDLETGTLGGLRNIPQVLNEINNLMDDESKVLKQEISEETERIEKAREELKSDIQASRKELDLAKTVEDEWQELMSWKEDCKDRGYAVVSGDGGEIIPLLREIDNRLSEILKLEREELEDVFGGSSASGIKGFIEDDLKHSMRTHQRVAMFREALVQISKETYKVDEGDYGVSFELATELGTSDLQEVEQAWVYNEKHTEKIEKTVLPVILEKEQELISEVEDVLEELENLIELDEELLQKMSDESSGGSILGIGSGELHSILKKEDEYRPDGTNVAEADDVEPKLPEALKLLKDISDTVSELKKESVGEEKGVKDLLSETKEYIGSHREKVGEELDRIEGLDTSDEKLENVPIGDYSPQITNKGEQLADLIRELKAARDGGYWDKDLESELSDLRDRARKLHELDHNEVEDIRDFEERVHRVRLMLIGDTENGDDVEGVVTAFREYKDSKQDVNTVLDLPKYDDIYQGFPGRTLNELPRHIRMKVQTGEGGIEDLSPANFMTQEDLLNGENSTYGFEYGLRDIYNPNTEDGAIQRLEEDIKKIYSEEEAEGDTFESIEKELKDINRKMEELAGSDGIYEQYLEFMNGLENTSITIQGGERNNIKPLVEEVAAMMVYDEDYDSKQRLRERLQNDIEDISHWVEETLPRLIDQIEETIYDEEGSIINEENVEEEEMEAAIKDLTEAINVLNEEFDGTSSVSGSTEEVQNIVDNILESLKKIASRCTSFRDREEKNIPELKKWADALEQDLEGFRERAEEHSEYIEESDDKGEQRFVPDNEPSDDIDHEPGS